MLTKDNTILTINDLRTYFHMEEGILKAVDGVSLTIKRNQTLGIVGESGCGKSVMALSILRVLPAIGRMAGEVLFHSETGLIDLAKLSPKGSKIREIRGREISMIFQEPMTAFSPVHSIGNQITEALLLHKKMSQKAAENEAIELLRMVGIASPQERVHEYPHHYSGGMRQRAMIAMALALKPKLLIADEPTTALDVTTQAQILKLMKKLQAEIEMSIIFISHDLGVIANMADEVKVMYLGYIVEEASVQQIFRSSRHPYTRSLLRSIPRTGRREIDRLAVIKGSVPLPLNMPPQCPFSSRCEEVVHNRCKQKVPELIEVDHNHQVRCVHYET